jgi:hypothetical protein
VIIPPKVKLFLVSLEFFNLRTGNKIRRSNWQKMVTSQAIIDKMNNVTSTVIVDEASPAMATNTIPEAQLTPEIQGISSEVENALDIQQRTDTVDITTPSSGEDVEVAEEAAVASESVEAPRSEIEASIRRLHHPNDIYS